VPCGLKWSGLLWDGPGEEMNNGQVDAVLIDDTTMIKTEFVNKRKMGEAHHVRTSPSAMTRSIFL
jgi:hypothetical protein